MGVFLVAQCLCCLPLVNVPIPFLGYYFSIDYTWWECHLECLQSPNHEGGNLTQVRPSRCCLAEIWTLNKVTKGMQMQMVETHASQCNFQIRLFCYSCHFYTQPPPKIPSFLILLLQTASQFYKSPMPLQQISLLLQARRVHFCCLRPESSMKMCPKGAQEPGYNKEKSANCFATT